MSHFFTADFIIPVDGVPIVNGVVETDENGVILALHKDKHKIADPNKVKRHKGVIVPGFVNAHCHLELSGLLGKIPRSTGLVEFLKAVIALRKEEDKDSEQAMVDADQQMLSNGIVAVGDHANTAISQPIKEKSQIYYHTFLENIGFDPALAEKQLKEGQEVQKQFGDLPTSLTPHAPYSVSRELLRLITRAEQESDLPISIHNQESQAENEFFRYKTGAFVAFYEWLDRDISYFKSHSKSSLQSIIPFLPKNRPVQLVHNTFTSSKDASYVHRVNRHVYWCLCPSANLYIEGTLPKLFNILYIDQPLTIGTDSLASNDRLCILSELKVLHAQYPDLKLPDMIKWATWNGAELLGITQRYGSIAPGKQPGLNLLQHTDGLSLTPETTVKRLI